jgi:hypothetical protein
MAGGGIGAAAAAAARARSEKSSSEQSNETDSTDEEKPSGSSSFMAGGGIAAAAAAAARARSEKSSSEQSKEETDSIDEEKPSGPPSFMAGGGIAAAVAAAARKREKSSSKQRKETDSIDEEKPSGSPPFTAGGGIAAAAAAAARAKSKENANSEEQQSDVGARESIVDYAQASYEGSLSSVQDIPEMSSESTEKTETTLEKSKPDTVWNAQGKLMVESDDEDVFFAAEEVEIDGSPTSNKDSNVKGAKTTEVMASSDPSTMSWIGRHLPRSFSSRSHEASDTTVESPVGLKKLPRSLPSSPIKSSPKSSKGLSKWMPHFGGHTETETPQIPSIEPSLSDTADVGSTSPGRSSSPLQRIMKRSQGNRNLTPKGSNGSGAGELEDA